MSSNKKPPFAVLLMNLGTPDAPTPSAVKKYLAEFLWDRRVVDVARPLWWLILHGIILRFRPSRVAKNYQLVWTDEGSPLLAISKQQRQGLEEKLEETLGVKIPVLLGMTYGSPSMEDVGRELRKLGIERLVVLPMYPQFSSSTTAAAFDRLAGSLKKCPHWPELRLIRDYATYPPYIHALAESVRQSWENQGKETDQLIMSFHGIPQRYTTKGDPYERHCTATANALAKELGLEENQWKLTFQSRFGREPWLQPYTDETMKALGAAKTDGISVICPGFSADCLETLEEIECENREYYEESGGKDFTYIPALNSRPEHIEMMQALILQHTQGW